MADKSMIGIIFDNASLIKTNCDDMNQIANAAELLGLDRLAKKLRFASRQIWQSADDIAEEYTHELSEKLKGKN